MAFTLGLNSWLNQHTTIHTLSKDRACPTATLQNQQLAEDEEATTI
jgi:hypothetical protein